MGIRISKDHKEKQCLWCGKQATIEYDGWNFCSRECANKWKRLKGK